MRDRTCLAVLIMGVVTLSARPLSAEGAVVIALHPLQPLGTAPDIARRLDELLLAELQRVPGVTTISPDTIGSLVATLPKRRQECLRETCLAELGRSAGAQKLIFGTVATLGDSYVLDLKLIDAASGVLERRHSVTLSGEQEIIIEALRRATIQLAAPHLYVGAMEIKLESPGAQVFVDGRHVGATPLAPLQDLEPGEHAVRIVLGGYADWNRFVRVDYGHTTEVQVQLTDDAIVAFIDPTSPGAIRPVPQEGMSEAWLWGGGVPAVVGLALGVTGGALVGYSLNNLYSLQQSAGPFLSETDQGAVVNYEDRASYQTEILEPWNQNVGIYYGGVGLVAAGAATALVGAGVLAYAGLTAPEQDPIEAGAAPASAALEDR